MTRECYCCSRPASKDYCTTCIASGRASILRRLDTKDVAAIRAITECWQTAMAEIRIAPMQAAIMLGRWEA